MSFQWIIDRAAEIDFDAREMTAITTTRSGVSRTVSRGGQPWTFTVSLPDGPRWVDYRQDYAAALSAGRHTAQDIQFNTSGQSWMFAYQGDLVGTQQGTWTQGSNQLTMTGGTGTGFRVRAGDLVQLGSGYVYQVVADVAHTSTTVTLHRPILDADGSSINLRTGVNCVFSVKCVEFPKPVFFANTQVGWSGPFRFVEDIN